MLRKLIKYEYHATYKVFCASFAGLLLVTLVTILLSKIDLFSRLPFSGVKNLFFIAMIIGCIALPIGSVIYIMYRFYKNLFSDEGYLTFTLPVTRMQIIISKFATGCTWLAGSIILSLGSIFLYFAIDNGFRTVTDFLHTLFDQMTSTSFTNSDFLAFSMILYVVCDILYMVSFVYAAFAFGQFMIPNHKILGAVLGYFALELIQEFISLIVMGLFMLFTSFSIKNPKLPPSYFLVYGLILFAMTFVWLFFTKVICTKKLNLS